MFLSRRAFVRAILIEPITRGGAKARSHAPCLFLEPSSLVNTFKWSYTSVPCALAKDCNIFYLFSTTSRIVSEVDDNQINWECKINTLIRRKWKTSSNLDRTGQSKLESIFVASAYCGLSQSHHGEFNSVIFNSIVILCYIFGALCYTRGFLLLWLLYLVDVILWRLKEWF